MNYKISTAQNRGHGAIRGSIPPGLPQSPELGFEGGGSRIPSFDLLLRGTNHVPRRDSQSSGDAQNSADGQN